MLPCSQNEHRVGPRALATYIGATADPYYFAVLLAVPLEVPRVTFQKHMPVHWT